MSPVTKVRIPEKRERLERILKEAIERFEHELLPDEERLLVLERIKRLQKLLAS
jgi:hypothetical protein